MTTPLNNTQISHATVAGTPNNIQSIMLVPDRGDASTSSVCPVGAAAILNAVAWPVAAIFLALMFRKTIVNFFSLFPKLIKRFKGGGVEIELNREAATEIRSYFKGAFNELIEKAREEFDHEIKVQRLGELLERVVTEALPKVVTTTSLVDPSRRATIYVPDIIFDDFLYQLTDYFPREAGKRSGRRFSMRFGIIGRVWRLGETIGKGAAVPKGDDAKIQRSLIEEWGMFRDEAIKSRGRPSYLCVLLKTELKVHGLLYIDSEKGNAFGDDKAAQEVAIMLEGHSYVRALAVAVERVLHPLSAGGTFIKISD